MSEIVDPDAIEDLDDLRDALDTLAQEVDRIDGNVDGLFNAVRSRNERIDELEQRIDDLEAELTTVDASVPEKKKQKRDKIKGILDYAVNDATGGMSGVSVDTGEATAAAGASRDTALRLMDELAATVEWADLENPGGPRPKQLKLAINGRGVNDLLADYAENTS